jgi:hypothetical protein
MKEMSLQCQSEKSLSDLPTIRHEQKCSESEEDTGRGFGNRDDAKAEVVLA